VVGNSEVATRRIKHPQAGHTPQHDPVGIRSLQLESSAWVFRHSDVVYFVDGLASPQAREVQ
jgi:hypothetical protein